MPSPSRATEYLVVSPLRSGEFDGIGDYAERLTQALSATTVPAVAVRLVTGVEALEVSSSGVAAVLLQYYPQAFLGGHGRGMVRWLQAMRAAGVPVITTLHELWPPKAPSPRRIGARFLMRRLATRFIARSSSVVCTQERSIRELAEARLVEPADVALIPVGSNIELAGTPPLAPRSTYTVTLFGQPAAMHGPTLVALADWLDQQQDMVTLRWLNRSAAEARQKWSQVLGLSDAHVEFFGGLPIQEASAVLASADVALAPYVDGVSTRRTTLVAQLQHGRPIVGTDGESTGSRLRHQAAMVLSPVGATRDFVGDLDRLLREPERRVSMGDAARALFAAEMSWPRIAEAYADLLRGDRPAQARI